MCFYQLPYRVTTQKLDLKRVKTSENQEVGVPKVDLKEGEENKDSQEVMAAKINTIIDNSGIFTYEDVYCICCTVTQPGVSYIGCELCEDWFHYECVGLDPATPIDKYICKTCCALHQKEYTYSTSPYEEFTEEEYVKLVLAGNRVPVGLPEKDILQNVYSRVYLWSMEAR